MSFDIEIEKLLGIEGGYVNDPLDSGGETIWGITARVARAAGYTGAMRDMTRERAKLIYREVYWNLLRLDAISELAPAVAAELFDTSVNQGQAVAGKYLQRSLNALNANASYYGDIEVDGLIGNMTVACLREFLRRRGAEGVAVMVRALNSLQGAFYIGLAESRPKDERFVYGWILNRVE